jgi:hypothetical protein
LKHIPCKRQFDNRYIYISIVNFNSGPCVLLYIAKENCVSDFCEFLGPFSREEFSKMPGTYVVFVTKENSA